LNDIGAKSSELQGVEAEIAALGCGAMTGVFTADVAIEDEVRALLVAIVEKFGGIDVVGAASSMHALVADGTFQMVPTRGSANPALSWMVSGCGAILRGISILMDGRFLTGSEH
jgi:NAD(P)-dependent dehydrogenase (short-subunit alcohol dehydrogenase family)